MHGRRLRDYEKEVLHGKIIAFAECGLSCREIGQKVNLSYSGVAKILRKWRRGVLTLRVPLGVARKTTVRADHYLDNRAK